MHPAILFKPITLEDAAPVFHSTQERPMPHATLESPVENWKLLV